MAYNYVLKNHLDEIIRNAYHDDPNVDRYTWFKLNVIDKKLKTKSGDYSTKTHVINVYDIKAKEANNIATLLHEVAHHVDWVQNGKTGHQQPFYDAFRRLMYSALDLNKIAVEDMLSLEHRNVDHNKILKMLNEYRQSDVNIETDDSLTIRISFDPIIEKLKENGYHYNSLNYSWDKKIERNNESDEHDFLISIGLNDELVTSSDSNTLSFQKKSFNKNTDDKERYKKNYKKDSSKKYTVFVKNCYDQKDLLKDRSYRWSSKSKRWYKTVDNDEDEISYLESIGISTEDILLKEYKR